MIAVQACPVCGRTGQPVRYSGLVDEAFAVASGEYVLRGCQCGALFQDPRPSDEEIPALYEDYYTHDVPVPVTDPTGVTAVLRRLRNGYANARLGHHQQPALRAGVLLGLIGPVRAIMERPIRSLPPGRVLDVGCGAGLFAAEGNAAGLEVIGTEIDDEQAAVARSLGVEVRTESLEEIAASSPGSFDAVTLSHVIEHVAVPVEFLSAAHRVLRPGGLIWIATPNARSAGHRRFGRHWRGLEPPRHLVVFDRAALALALDRAGFDVVEFKRSLMTSWWIFGISQRGVDGQLPTDRGALPPRAVRRGRLADLWAQVRPATGEETVVVARARLT